ncbi:hypothetical protein [Bacillus cereus group sp. BfR-BA-01328]|uniref:AbiTii domain-containing protein n=1 Tax=Bacillus cereus group sp. BfR-BA-01328 TaxID=2920304 RepID=UPI001F574888
MVTTSLVNELLSKALDDNCPVPNLVNHAFVVAKKLKVQGFANWLNFEMKGYEYEYEIPSYRRCIVEVRALDRNRWVPIVLEEEDARNLSEVFMNPPIATLSSWVDAGKSEIELPFMPEYQKDLMIQLDIHQRISRFISAHQVKQIMDDVKTGIIEWALRLEEEGIVGEGMMFSKAEQEKAKNITYNINTINGPMIGSQIQQSTKDSIQEQSVDYTFVQETLEDLKRELPHMGLSGEEQSKIETLIQAVSPLVQAQNSSTNGITRELFSSIRNILEGITASQTHSILKDKLDMIISFFS